MLSQRLLANLPQACAVAVDLDPVLLAMGQGAVGTMDARLRWVEAELCEPGWVEQLGGTSFDTVFSWGVTCVSLSCGQIVG